MKCAEVKNKNIGIRRSAEALQTQRRFINNNTLALAAGSGQTVKNNASSFLALHNISAK